MNTFLNHGRWNRCSCIHKNDAELFFNIWHQLTKFSETGWPRSACNFMFPLRSRRNRKCYISELLTSFPKWTCFFTWGKARGVPDDVYCTLENDVIHVHCTLILILEFSFKFISIEKNWNGYRFANFLLK
jgi:hypothetical protein